MIDPCSPLGLSFQQELQTAQAEAVKAVVDDLLGRTHPTCLDVTSLGECPGTDWVCGPDCPR